MDFLIHVHTYTFRLDLAALIVFISRKHDCEGFYVMFILFPLFPRKNA